MNTSKKSVAIGLLTLMGSGSPLAWSGPVDEEASGGIEFGSTGLHLLVPQLLSQEAAGFGGLDDPDGVSAGVVPDPGHPHQRREYPWLVGQSEPSYLWQDSNALNTWGVEWQHRVDEGLSLSVSARYGENLHVDTASPATSTMATVSWTNQWLGQGRTSLTGSVFVGDDAVRDDYEQDFDRKYFGFTLGGQMTLFRNHTPYLAFKMLKSDYESELPLYLESEDDTYFSSLSAGWDWKVVNNWNVRAEANYTLNGSEPDWSGSGVDRNRIFFGTRYDFNK